ncbi:uncharacterized protein LOC116349820 [Contarinia nasturtii]|uniref:uncharacterized protein LOC116349820 n=1 Tax=Contarinia nasturtii TaxID=265458 RepID=UPI0012D478FB|nr:uncharacterized protein LOC116349820 [Contarinia nasturtii]
MSSIKLDGPSNQPIWESSRRPLHPKCVWIESFGATGTLNGGHRHFIFDYNLSTTDRLRNETASLTIQSPSSLDKMESFDALETKMMSLSIVGSSDKMQNDRVFNSLEDRSQMSDFSSDKEILTNSFESTDEEPLAESMPKEMPSTPSFKRITNEIDSNKNLLAERVLQWLDLAAGRNHTSTKQSEYIGKLLHTSKRRSVTAKESRKQNDLDLDDAQVGTKRRESIRQLSMTFNEESPIKESSQCLNSNIVSLSFIDLFPTTYKCSRKFLSLRRPKTLNDRLEPLDLQISLPLKPNAKKSTKHFGGRFKTKRLEYFDDQYSSIIQRQILETSCNTQVAKRQLHIFMPNLPKRCLVVNDGDKMSTLVSPKSGQDSESCYS